MSNKAKLYLLISSLEVLSLTGCNKESSIKESTIIESSNEETTMESTTNIEETTIVIDKDSEIKEFFNNEYNSIKESINNIDKEAIKTKAKSTFITFVDFVFYDKEINGVTYDELTDDMKKQLYDDFCTMDDMICKVVPDYKENISNKYNVVKGFIKPKYYSIVNKIKEAIGDDNLDTIKELYEDDKERLSDLYEKGKQKIKNKYESFRNK